MTLGELYFANDNWTTHSTLVLVDEDCTVIENGIKAHFAYWSYGEREVHRFRGNAVMLKTLKKEGNSNE